MAKAYGEAFAATGIEVVNQPIRLMPAARITNGALRNIRWVLLWNSQSSWNPLAARLEIESRHARLSGIGPPGEELTALEVLARCCLNEATSP